MAPSSFSSADLTFGLSVMQLKLRAKSPLSFGRFAAANLIRGQFGREMFCDSPEIYDQLLAPPGGSQSGLKDAPRPYVLRTHDLDGRTFAAGQDIPFRVHVFKANWPGCEPVLLDLSAKQEAVARVKVEFLTPTDLKGVEGIEFGGLFARLRDRVSTLRMLYGAGPLGIDFREMGQRAQAVRAVRVEVKEVQRNRVSRSSGQRHSIGGFVGEVEYEGELAEFLPYLEAGYWTGVGRHTVWGNGEIRATALP